MLKPEIEVFQEFLALKGMRVTPEREAFLAEVFAHHDHFDVKELTMRLRQKGLRISRASVYRTMALLVESSLVQEVFVEDGHMHFEHIYGHEHHCLFGGGAISPVFCGSVFHRPAHRAELVLEVIICQHNSGAITGDSRFIAVLKSSNARNIRYAYQSARIYIPRR